jgi:probable HAF family extracellular repeat protein
VLWSPSGKATVLQDAGGQGFSQVNAINDAGRSVGYSFTGALSPTEAALWSPTGKATDLGALLGPAWSDTEALGINNSGDIIGFGHYHA